MRRKSAVIAGILASMASPGSVIATGDYPRLQGTDLQRMRQDVRRIGGDFKVAINRSYGQKKK